jgi:hypothetical protein
MTIIKKVSSNYIQENLQNIYKDITAPKVNENAKNGCRGSKYNWLKMPDMMKDKSIFFGRVTFIGEQE